MPSSAKPSCRLFVAFVVLTSCVGCDQATKRLATQTLRDAPPRSYLADTVRLQYAQNPGGFLSLGSDLPPRIRFGVFVAVNAALLAIVAYVLATWKSMPQVSFFALALILAGGVGNFIDRVTQNGLVTDFLNLGLGSLRTGIFNVADVAVMIGVLAFSLRCVPRNAGQLQRDD